MLSIILSTYRPELLKKVETNIASAIGIPYEIIPILNKGQMGICQAYNLGASKSQFDLLCFLHEDVEFITQDWGRKISELFNSDKELVLAGLGGCKYKSSFVTGWTSGQPALDLVNIYHKEQNGDLHAYHFNAAGASIAEAVVLDGVCLFMRKSEWLKTPFDESIKGFHFYDVDISLRVSAGKGKVAVIFFIDLIHYSTGRFDDIWLEAAFEYHGRTNKKELIAQVQTKGDVAKYDQLVKLFWFDRLGQENISIVNKLKLFLLNYRLYKKAFQTGKQTIKRRIRQFI